MTTTATPILQRFVFGLDCLREQGARVAGAVAAVVFTVAPAVGGAAPAMATAEAEAKGKSVERCEAGWVGPPGPKPPGNAATQRERAGLADLAGSLEPIRVKHDLPGLAAAVVGGDGLAAIGAVGVRQRGEDVPLTAGDRFHFGSCTKAMTATMIATLVERGELDWNTTVGETFGDAVESIEPRWKAVTLEQLLTNCGGAPENLDADGLWGRLWQAQGKPAVEQRMMLVEGVLERPPAYEPGARFVYSNAGFAIAGAMAERATGLAWEDLMRQRLFEPLGMTSTGFGPRGSAAALDEPRGHDASGAARIPGLGADNPAAIGPAGTVHGTLEDWAKFVGLHLQAARGECRLLTCEGFQRLHAPRVFEGAEPDDGGYAMGWIVTQRPWAVGEARAIEAAGAAAQADEERAEAKPGLVLTHAGSNTLWFCVTWIAPQRDFAVLVACNQGGDAAAKACDEAAGTVIRWWLDETRGDAPGASSAPDASH